MIKTRMRRFVLQREEDVSGTSGIGLVAEGCEFTSGWCAVTWMSAMGTWAWYPSIKAIEGVHGHDGKTRVVWIDEEVKNGAGPHKDDWAQSNSKEWKDSKD